MHLDLTIILHPEYKFGYEKMSNLFFFYIHISLNNDSIYEILETISNFFIML